MRPHPLDPFWMAQLAALALVVPSPVSAHDIYTDWKSKSGYSCCNSKADSPSGDCEPTRAYLDDQGRWHAVYRGEWVIVPEDAVLGPSPDFRSHVCGRGLLPMCFKFGPIGG